MGKDLTTDEIMTLLRRRVADAGTQAAWCRMHGVSVQYLCDALAGRREIGPLILGALGYERLPVLHRAVR